MPIPGAQIQPPTAKRTVACNSGAGLVPLENKCVCRANLTWNDQKCIAPPSAVQRQAPLQQQPVPQLVCISNQVRLANGQCGCPSNKPRWSKGKCKKEKGVNRFLKQLQQPQMPQNQPQTQPQQQPPQNQGQQQLQNLLNQFSDAQLKRDIEYLTTISNGIKLYVFRYVWEDAVRVGVMAQDLLASPAWRDAVSLHASRYYRVDYGRLGLRMATRQDWQARGLISDGRTRRGPHQIAKSCDSQLGF